MTDIAESKLFRQFETVVTPENLAAAGLNVPHEIRTDPDKWRQYVIKMDPWLAQHLGTKATTQATEKPLPFVQ